MNAVVHRKDLMKECVRRVSLEGIIGAGKSLFLDCLNKQVSKTRSLALTIVDEPVKEWCKTVDGDGKSVLSYFYDDIERYSFMFQINALMTRYSATTRANDVVQAHLYDSRSSFQDSCCEHAILFERTIATDREVFAKMLRESGKLNEIEHQVYKNTYDTLVARRPEYSVIDGVIYIHTTPTEAKERIDGRNREGENVEFEYLCGCQAAHDEWLSHADRPVLIVDGSIHASDARYADVIRVAECFLTNNHAITSSGLPPSCSDWAMAIRQAEQHNVSLYDPTPVSMLGQEVQGIDQGLPIAAGVVEAISGVAVQFPEESPFEEPTPVYACD